MDARTEKRQAALDRLAALLREQKLTARQIAKRTRCSKPTVYSRLASLRERGENLVATAVHDRASGPFAKAYQIQQSP